MTTPANCEWARNYLPLYLYHELSGEEEETLEGHLSACADCRAALEAERQFHAALDRGGESADAPLPVGLLNACRDRLAEELAGERAQAKTGFLDRMFERFRFAAAGPWLRPAGALALVAVGFFGGKLVSNNAAPSTGGASMVETSIAEPIATRVRRVEPSGSGGEFQIVLEETRQRVVSGTPAEDRIRQLILTAANDPASDAGVRGESIGILGNVPPSDETRQALLQALQTDSNDGVRLRALQGLKAIAQQSDVRRVLTQVLLKDSNAGVRTQAIDLLTENVPVPSPGRESDMIGVFQDLMGREQNHYIRMRIERQLQMVKASTQVY